MWYLRNATFTVFSGSVLLAFAVPAKAGGVTAATLIENNAQATYDAGNGPETINSNTVVLRVDELLDVAVASLDAGPVAANSGNAVLTFSVTNTGNGPEAYSLTVNPSLPGNDFDPTVDGIAVDTNGNGVYDPGVDLILTGPATTAILNPDQALTVFVLLSIPASAIDTNKADVDLLAAAVTGTGTPGTTFAGQGKDGADAIVGPNGADANATGKIIVGITTVKLVKTATVVDPFGGSSIVPGSVITYIIATSVTGSGSVSNLVISDPIPAGTTYQTSTLELGGNLLTDAADGDAGQASDAGGIAVNLGTVTAGTNYSITFGVSVDR